MKRGGEYEEVYRKTAFNGNANFSGDVKPRPGWVVRLTAGHHRQESGELMQGRMSTTPPLDLVDTACGLSIGVILCHVFKPRALSMLGPYVLAACVIRLYGLTFQGQMASAAWLTVSSCSMKSREQITRQQKYPCWLFVFFYGMTFRCG